MQGEPAPLDTMLYSGGACIEDFALQLDSKQVIQMCNYLDTRRADRMFRSEQNLSNDIIHSYFNRFGRLFAN